MRQPVAAEQGLDLGDAFTRVEAKMGIDDLNLPAVKVDGNPEHPAWFQVRLVGEPGQRTGLDQALRQMRQDGIPLAFLL